MLAGSKLHAKKDVDIQSGTQRSLTWGHTFGVSIIELILETLRQNTITKGVRADRGKTQVRGLIPGLLQHPEMEK